MISTDSVSIGNEAIRLEILLHGATLRRFEVALPDGSWRNILLGHPNLTDYAANPGFLGASVGRFANRIAEGRFTLDNVEYRVDVNEFPNQLHGGSGGYWDRDWEIAGKGPDWAEFRFISVDGDQGYPGRLDARAKFELVTGGAQVTYTATTDAPTVVNLTSHGYFNLDGEGSGDTDQHLLMMHSSYFTPTRDDGIPTGEIRDVTGSAADFRRPVALGEQRDRAEAEGITRNGGYDHNFAIDGSGLREHAKLTGATGLCMTIRSDQPALQYYGGGHFTGEPGTSGSPYPRRAGIALETQGFPDAPNQPSFPSTVLRPGETYSSHTQWLFSWE